MSRLSLPNLVLAVIGVAMMSLWQPVASHGRLYTPPARGTMWRFGFQTPVNYQDNEMFCGGFQHQVNLGYKCGLCGDPWDSNRPHEAGGKYATGTIAATYVQGQSMDIAVELTANHKGWFEFKICPTNNYLVKATQECLDVYPLQLADGSGTKLDVTGMGSVMVTIPVTLPANLTCDFCVLQWHYHTGNSWGVNSDGQGCVGCGYQEEFYGCSDIRINPSNPGSQAPASTQASTQPNTQASTQPNTQSTTEGAPQTAWTQEASTTSSPSWPHSPEASTPSTTAAPDTGDKSVPMVYACRGLLFIPGLQQWCNTNCNMDYCPASHCECVLIPDIRASQSDELPAGCYATSPFATWPGMDDWCQNTCAKAFCPPTRCFCKN